MRAAASSPGSDDATRLSDSPSTYSMAMNEVSPSRPTSYTVTTFGCCRRPASFASLRNRASRSARAAPLASAIARSVLTATVRSISGSRAR